MGCSKSRPVEPGLTKCLREGCVYAKHSTQAHGYCCNACCNNHPVKHGPLCERISVPAMQVEPVEPSTTPSKTPSKTAEERGVELTWQPSLLFGKSQLPGVTATETMHIEAHKGELFASFGKWMSKDFREQKPKKNIIGRLAEMNGEWQVDLQCQGLSEHATRFTCLKSVTFHRDHRGQELQPPVNQLTACYCLGARGNYIMFRDDRAMQGSQHLWKEVNYTGKCPDMKGSGTARAVLVHRDSVTGVDRLLALQGNLGVMAGVYDPHSAQAGGVVWDTAPEALDLSTVGDGKAKQLQFRPLSLVSARGMCYMSSAGWILRRNDGPKAVWRGVLDLNKVRARDGELNEAVGGIRGMTHVADQQGEAILFCWNPNNTSFSWILKAQVNQDGSLEPPVEETSINAVARQYLKTEHLSYTLAAYNNMLPAQVGHISCHLIGFQIVAHGPATKQLALDPGQLGKGWGYWKGGGIAVRVNGGDYFMIEVGGRGGVPQPLTAVRCFCVSPFQEQAIYFGGYDCNSHPSEHTGWVYKCTM